MIVLYRFQPDALMIIDAETRYFAYRVGNPEQAQIRFPTAVEVRSDVEDEAERCVVGIFKPAQGTEVRYKIVADTMLVQYARKDNELGGEFIFLTEGRPESIPLSTTGYLAYGGSSVCQGQTAQPLRIPIWGPAVLGMSPQPPSLARSTRNTDTYGGMLLSGRVSVFGRSVAPFSSEKRLYPAGEFDLVAGGRLGGPETGSACASNTGDRPNSPAMFGQALYVPPDAVSAETGPDEVKRTRPPISDPSSMSISASLLARHLSVSRLGVVRDECAGGMEKIGVSFFSYVFNDTFVLALQFTLLTALAVAQSLINVRELFR